MDMKKLIISILSVALLFACGKEEQPAKPDSGNTDTEQKSPVSQVSIDGKEFEAGATVVINGKGFVVGCKINLKNSSNTIALVEVSKGVAGVSARIPENTPAGDYKVILVQDGEWELGSITVKDKTVTPGPGPVIDPDDEEKDLPKPENLASVGKKLKGIEVYSDGTKSMDIVVEWDGNYISSVTKNGEKWYESKMDGGVLKAEAFPINGREPDYNTYEYVIADGRITNDYRTIIVTERDRIYHRGYAWGYEDGCLSTITRTDDTGDLQATAFKWDNGNMLSVYNPNNTEERADIFTYGKKSPWMNEDNVNIAFTINELLSDVNVYWDESIMFASWMGLTGHKGERAPLTFNGDGTAVDITYELDADNLIIKASTGPVFKVMYEINFLYL